MKLWEIVIGLIKLCTKFWQKLPGNASSTCKTVFEKLCQKSYGVVGVYRVDDRFLLFLRGNQVCYGHYVVYHGLLWLCMMDHQHHDLLLVQC